VNGEQAIQERVLADVVYERGQQDQQWGVSDHPPHIWALIVAKHAGKLADDALDFLASGGADSDEALAFLSARERAIKIAAVCVAFAECIDRTDWFDHWHGDAPVEGGER
jgi:hypothetical protein